MDRELAKLLGSTLIERRDVYAVQQANGSYRPKIERGTKAEQKQYVRLRLPDIVDHLNETVTIGHYLVSAENTCRTFCFDIDLRKAPTQEAVDRGDDIHVETSDGLVIDPRAVWAGGTTPIKQDLAVQLRMMAGYLAKQIKEYVPDALVLVTISGNKGMHVYGVTGPGTPAAEARELAQLVLGSFENLKFAAHRGDNFFRVQEHTDLEGKRWRPFPALEIEVFPKQDAVNGSDGIGNLLRLPLGLNRKSGKRGYFADMTLGEGKLGKDDPMTALTQGSLR